MAFLHDNVLDNGIQYIDTNISDLYIVSQTNVTSYSDATTTGGSMLGQEDSPVCSAPQNGDVSGRKVTISAITAGSILADGTARGYAIVYDSASIVMASGSLSASQAVTNGNPFTLTAIDIEIPDAL